MPVENHFDVLNNMFRVVERCTQSPSFHMLDKESMMPRIGVDALELAFIPRSMPAELNNITLADRLAKLELVIEKMGEHLERDITENGSLHGRILLLEKKAADAVVKKSDVRQPTGQ